QYILGFETQKHHRPRASRLFLDIQKARAGPDAVAHLDGLEDDELVLAPDPPGRAQRNVKAALIAGRKAGQGKDKGHGPASVDALAGRFLIPENGVVLPDDPAKPLHVVGVDGDGLARADFTAHQVPCFPGHGARSRRQRLFAVPCGVHDPLPSLPSPWPRRCAMASASAKSRRARCAMGCSTMAPSALPTPFPCSRVAAKV